METKGITKHLDLELRILQVQETKDYQERELKESFKNFAHALSPVQVVKSTLHELVKDKEVQFDLIKGGMKVGVNFIIDNILNENNSFKGYVGSMLLKKASSTLISANAPQIIIGITDLISGKPGEK